MKVNDDRDAIGYDQYRCEHDEIFSMDALHRAMHVAMKEKRWKESVQSFYLNFLTELSKLHKEIQEGTYRPVKCSESILSERGKKRLITSGQFRDRIVEHTLCDDVLLPTIRPYLVYDNSACIPGRGVRAARDRLVVNLSRYYRLYGNDGYILLIDFSKYYDNLRHDVIMEEFRRFIDDPFIISLIERIVEGSQVDVSYMSDEEYKGCMNTLFNSLEYVNIDRSLLTGEKMMPKHLNIGDHLSQIIGIMYPYPIDNYVKIVKGEKYFARFVDDSYVISPSREHLEQLLNEITVIAGDLGITINRRKTHIAKLSETWKFLQIKYTLTGTGKIVRRISPKALQRKRVMLRKLSTKISAEDLALWFWPWYKSYSRYMSNVQKLNIKKIFYKYEEVAKCTKSH